MNRTKHWGKRLQKAAADRPCNHRLGVLFDPTEEEVEEIEKQLAICPNCVQENGPKIMIIRG